MAFIDRTGQKFNYWECLSFSHRDKSNTFWKCRCKCGTEKVVAIHRVVAGDHKSCGCLKSESMKKRNLKGTAGLPRRKLTYRGRTMTAAAWARVLQVPYHRISSRLALGFSTEETLSHRRIRQQFMTVGGKTMPLVDWAKKTGLSYGTLYGRVRQGWSPEEVIGRKKRSLRRVQS